jgi:hypothetical protein
VISAKKHPVLTHCRYFTDMTWGQREHYTVAGSARAALQPRYSWGCRSQQGKEEFSMMARTKKDATSFMIAFVWWKIIGWMWLDRT